jgi:hypothetical protein
MICIWTSGRIKNRKRVEQFVYDCFNHYFDGRLKRDVQVDVHFRDKIQDDVSGWCSGDKDEIRIEIARDYPDTKTLLRNIAHEIVHAKQFIRGEINDREEMWMKGGKKKFHTGEAYRSLPWEREAFREEKKLVKLYWDGWIQ